jgi:co-chaperonin GroES (HSP10)
MADGIENPVYIEPAGHRVLVKVDEYEKVTKGGIIIADAIRDKMTEANIFGTIVKVGMNAWKAFDGGEPWAEVGDRVAFAKYGGFVIENPETKEQFRLLNDEDITAILRRPKDGN